MLNNDEGYESSDHMMAGRIAVSRIRASFSLSRFDAAFDQWIVDNAVDIRRIGLTVAGFRDPLFNHVRDRYMTDLTRQVAQHMRFDVAHHRDDYTVIRRMIAGYITRRLPPEDNAPTPVRRPTEALPPRQRYERAAKTAATFVASNDSSDDDQASIPSPLPIIPDIPLVSTFPAPSTIPAEIIPVFFPLAPPSPHASDCHASSPPDRINVQPDNGDDLSSDGEDWIDFGEVIHGRHPTIRIPTPPSPGTYPQQYGASRHDDSDYEYINIYIASDDDSEEPLATAQTGLLYDSDDIEGVESIHEDYVELNYPEDNVSEDFTEEESADIPPRSGPPFRFQPSLPGRFNRYAPYLLERNQIQLDDGCIFLSLRNYGRNSAEIIGFGIRPGNFRTQFTRVQCKTMERAILQTHNPVALVEDAALTNIYESPSYLHIFCYTHNVMNVFAAIHDEGVRHRGTGVAFDVFSIRDVLGPDQMLIIQEFLQRMLDGRCIPSILSKFNLCLANNILLPILEAINARLIAEPENPALIAAEHCTNFLLLLREFMVLQEQRIEGNVGRFEVLAEQFRQYRPVNPTCYCFRYLREANVRVNRLMRANAFSFRDLTLNLCEGIKYSLRRSCRTVEQAEMFITMLCFGGVARNLNSPYRNNVEIRFVHAPRVYREEFPPRRGRGRGRVAR